MTAAALTAARRFARRLLARLHPAAPPVFAYVTDHGHTFTRRDGQWTLAGGS